MAKTNGYNCYPGSGWRSFGRLVVNFHQYQITSVYFNGELIWGS